MEHTFKSGDRVIFSEGDNIPQKGTFHSYVTIAENKSHCHITPDKVRIANELRLIHLFYVKPESIMSLQSKLIGNPTAEAEAMDIMKRKGGRWAAFQNHDLGSLQIGHLKFIQFGASHNVFPDADSLPSSYPHDSIAQGRNYLLVGEVNMEDGSIKPLE